MPYCTIKKSHLKVSDREILKLKTQVKKKKSEGPNVGRLEYKDNDLIDFHSLKPEIQLVIYCRWFYLHDILEKIKNYGQKID